ncbi:DUF59 domain-containing protein [Sulfidibacter corallicola]|uniref:DUF59 domain-containing protein n=1 Tax=Sulfidibacter corallicola TaxID=2818388 RepID=A0A8A4TC34_SULCO|nr:iron-sulfur cluster assembly protein [Sulfidibacter corallicola]QTD47669.1 DUF59 domain-containing protein [Sulfidibacter corallicola]
MSETEQQTADELVPGTGGDAALRHEITEALRQVFDPEIPVNIYEMGLIYRVDVEEEPHVKAEVQMTLTTPNCPAAQELPMDVQRNIEMIPSIGQVVVDIVWDPPWTPEMMSEEAKFELGMI